MKFLYPIKKLNLKPWIKYWLLKKTSGESTLKAITISTGTLKKVDKSKALSIKEYYGNTVQNGTPSPQAPVEIKTITGENTFTINSNTYRIDLENIELCKIGNYQDKLYYDSGKWYVEKKIRKVLITSDLISSFQNIKTISKEARVTKTSIDCLQGNVTRYFCDTFNYVTNTWNIDEIGIFSNSGSNNDQIAFRIPVDSDKTFFDTCLTTLYYQLATPTYTEITNSNLILQLNALYEFYVQSSTVSISNNSEIPLEVLLEYYGR